MIFDVHDAPSDAQKVDLETWKKERNEEMAKLPTCEMFDADGYRSVVNVKDVEELKKRGYREIDQVGKAKDEPVKPSPKTKKPIEKSN